MAEARLTINVDDTLRLHLDDAQRRMAEQDAIIGEKSALIADLRAELADLRNLANEVRKYWRDWPKQRRDAVRQLSQFLAGAIENMSVSLSRWDAEYPEGGER